MAIAPNTVPSSREVLQTCSHWQVPDSTRAERIIGRLYGAVPILFLLLTTPFVNGSMLRMAAIAAVMFGWTQIVGPCGVAHVGGLTPLWHGASRRTWLKAVISYTVAGVMSASLVGGFFGVVGQILPRSGSLLDPIVLGTFCLVLLFREAGILRIPLPEMRRQTRWKWFPKLPAHANSTMWGFDVGLGFVTWISFSGIWLVMLVAIGSGNPVYGALVFCLYWLGRAAPHWIDPIIMCDPGKTPVYMDVVRSQFARMRVVHMLTLGWVIVSLVALL